MLRNMDNCSKYSQSVFMCNDIYRRSTFDKNHPLSIPRVPATVDLIKQLEWLPDNIYYESSIASIEELLYYYGSIYAKKLGINYRLGDNFIKEFNK